MPQEQIDMKGRLTLSVIDRSDRLVWEKRYDNRIVQSGRRLVAQMFGGVDSGALPTKVTHLAVGSGANPATDDDLALQTQRGARKAISRIAYSDFVEPASGNAGPIKRVRVSVTAVFDFAEANDPATPLREAGIFNAAANGIMYNRVVFEPVTKTDTFKLTLLWDIVF